MKVLSYPAIFTVEDSGIDVSFPDFPRAHTCGKTVDEAYSMAVDCLHAAIEYALEDKEKIPEPSRVKPGQYSIPVPLDLAPKLALLQLMREKKLSNVKLADKLAIRESAVRRMLDPNHQSKPEQYIRALNALGAAVEMRLVKKLAGER